MSDRKSSKQKLRNADKAYIELKRQILNNERPPGHIALEQEVAESLGMSRTPVHQALIQLKDDGLIEVLPRRGIRILPISRDDMREIYEVLSSLESTAAGLLAARPLEEIQDVVFELEESVLAMNEALAKNDLNAWAEADETFHGLLLENCGNKRLAQITYTYWDQSHRVRMTTLRLRPKPTRSTQDHIHLISAIKAGDSKAAFEMHREHRQMGMEVLLKVLDDAGLIQL